MLKNLLYLFTFLLPIQTCYITRELFINNAKWEYGTICFYLTDLILLLLFSLFIFRSFSALKFKKITKLPNISKISILLIIWVFLSVFWSPDKQLAFYFAIKLASAIALFFVILNTKINWKKLFLIFILSATLQSSLGLWQFFTQGINDNKYLGISAHHPITLGVSVIQTPERRWLRSYGGLQHPNILGGYLAIALILTCFLYLKASQELKNQTKKDLYARLFLLVSLILLFSGLITTFSRSAWLVFALGFLFFIIRNFKQNKAYLLKILFIFSIITLFFTFNFKEAFLPRLTINNRLEAQSIEERVNYTKQAKDLIKEHLFLGVGGENYTIANYNKLKKDLPAWYFQPVHNGYLLILAEIGIIGIILFLSFLLLLLKQSKKNNIFFIITISLLFLMLFDHWLWSNHFGLLLLFFFFGVLARNKA